MPETYSEYPVMEIAVSLFYKPDLNGAERAQEGDIIACRRPGPGIGLKEAHKFLWMRIQGPDYNDFAQLTQPVEGYEKRRYSIPLENLKVNFYPALDLTRLRDENDLYQPFLVTDTDQPYLYMTDNPPFPVEGLIFDKEAGGYL